MRRGGIITFDCGGPATIRITSQKDLPINRDTVIDGGGEITLDGSNLTRILSFNSDDFRVTRTTVTLQNLTMINGSSWGTEIPPAAAPCSQGVDLDGSGAAIYIRDGQLHVIGCTFRNNHAAPLGPDVAGGAIYAAGSLDTTIIGSTFEGNTGSNGGAIGSLLSNLTMVNNSFSGNQAIGTGGNQRSSSCPRLAIFWGEGRSGSGGNGGAVVLDGQEDSALTVLCNNFSHNNANAFGGALFRTPNDRRQHTRIDRSTFDSNTALENAGAAYIQNSLLEVSNTTFSNNTAANGGALQAPETILDFTNVTMTGNRAINGLGGAIFMDGSGSIVNCTFANNTSNFFGAAISTDSPLTVRNTIFADNTAPEPYNPMACTHTMSGDGNLQWPRNRISDPYWADDECSRGIQFAQARLLPLQDNGGLTLTMLPQADNSVVQVGWGCPATDQTGAPRREPCTIGALER